LSRMTSPVSFSLEWCFFLEALVARRLCRSSLILVPFIFPSSNGLVPGFSSYYEAIELTLISDSGACCALPEPLAFSPSHDPFHLTPAVTGDVSHGLFLPHSIFILLWHVRRVAVLFTFLLGRRPPI